MQFEEEISDDQSWQIFLTNRIWMNWYFLCVFCIWTMKICYLLFFRINKDINIILIQRLIINPRSGQPQQLVVKWPHNCSITPTLAALHTTHTPDIMSLAPGTVTPWTMMYIMHTLCKMYFYYHHFQNLILEILAARRILYVGKDTWYLFTYPLKFCRFKLI